jgi:hypothetical protein
MDLGVDFAPQRLQRLRCTIATCRMPGEEFLDEPAPIFR